MKAQSRDTHPDAERVPIELLRSATVAQRASLAFQLSESAIELARRALRRAHPDESAYEIGLRFVAIHYGQELADRLRLSGRQEVAVLEDANIPDALAPVIRAFGQLGVSYYVGGSVASSVYGMARTTIDVDVVANLRLEHVRLLAAHLQSAYYLDETMMEDAIRRKTSFKMIHEATMLKIDVFIPKGEPYDAVAALHIRMDTLNKNDDRLFYVASPEDVILRKLEWYRAGGEVSERQWSDAVGVLKVQGEALEQAYLREWAGQLGVADLLERALGEAGLPF